MTWTGPRRLLAGVASGLLYVAAFPPYGLGALGWCCFVPACVAVRRATIPQTIAVGVALGTAATVGIGTFGYPGARGHMGLSAPNAALLVFGGLALFGAYRGGLAFGLAALLRRWGRWPFALALAVGWTVAELCRSETWGGAMPWGQLGITQAGHPLLAQCAAFGGLATLGAVMVLVNSAIAGGVADRGHRTFHGAILAALAGGVLLFGVYRLRAVDAAIAAAPTVRVGLVQAALPGAGQHAQAARTPDERLRLVRLTRAARRHGAAVVLWPESSGGLWPVGDAAAYWSTLRSEDFVLLAGVLEQRTGPPGRAPRRYDAAVWTDGPAGSPTGVYRKRALVPFAERLPRWWPGGPTGRDGALLTPGSGAPLVFRHGDWRVAPFICFEFMVPSVLRASVEADPDWLAILSNDGWFAHTGGPAQHDAHAALAAVAARRPVVRVANRGISRAFDPAGRPLPLSGWTQREDSDAAVPADAAFAPMGRIPEGYLGAAVVDVPLLPPAARTAGLPEWAVLVPLGACGLASTIRRRWAPAAPRT